MQIIKYSKCRCGAITIYTQNNNYSLKWSNRKVLLPNYDLRSLRGKLLPMTKECNHCSKKIGLDLCGCGSGQLYGKCKNNTEQCKKAMQNIL